MSSIFVIAKNTFRATIRARILYGAMGFSFLFIAFTLFLASISLGEDIRIIRDLGMAGMYLFSIIIAIFLGASLLYQEFEHRTLYTVLSKPVSRGQLIVGKFFGLLASTLVATTLMAMVYLSVVAFYGNFFDTLILPVLFMQMLEIGIFVALAILFSSFSTPLGATVYSVLTLYIGHALDVILVFGKTNGGITLYITQAIYYIFPNLEKFNMRIPAVYNHVLPPDKFVFAALYAVLYIFVALMLANALFKRREL